MNRKTRGRATSLKLVQKGSTAALPGLNRKLSVQEYVLGEAGKRAYVIDDFIAEPALSAFYEYFKKLPHEYVRSNSKANIEAKFLTHRFSESEWESDRFLVILQSLSKAFLEIHGLRPSSTRRIYTNFNLYGEHQYAHLDGDEWTCLFFLNKEWQDDWAGEFLLYQDADQTLPALAIKPKPGRLVVFDGLLLHRGGVPSKVCTEPRITLAIKVGRMQKPTRADLKLLETFEQKDKRGVSRKKKRAA